MVLKDPEAEQGDDAWEKLKVRTSLFCQGGVTPLRARPPVIQSGGRVKDGGMSRGGTFTKYLQLKPINAVKENAAHVQH